MGLIYKITNKINGKIYIGETVQDFERRCRPQAYKSCTALSAAFEKYGWENFDKQIIEDDIEESLLASKEESYILQFNSMTPNGYNIIQLYDGLNRYTQETKDKISTSRNKYLEGLKEQGINLVAVNKKEYELIAGVPHKHCSKCNDKKILSDFPKNKSRWDGLNPYCKICHNALRAKDRETNPHIKLNPEELKQSYIDRVGKQKESMIRYYEENPNVINKISKERSKPIMAIHINDGSILKFDSALKAKKLGFDNTNIGKSIKSGIPYKKYRWAYQ